MAKAVGVGAVMIYARDPAALAAWYADHLGIRSTLDDSDGCWYGQVTDRATGTFAHFGIYPAKVAPRARAVMINYTVDDLDGFVADLRRKGVEIERTLDESYGRFAYIRDLEGNRIEIWTSTGAHVPGM
jgi:glyoxylase I family protein